MVPVYTYNNRLEPGSMYATNGNSPDHYLLAFLNNRLAWASDSGGWSRSFGYDAFGNEWITANSGTVLAGNTLNLECVYGSQSGGGHQL